MKKFLTFVVALVMTIPMMAIGRNDGSTKANAIDFDWETPMTHTSGTKWYRVDLAPLYEEETPALNLFLANKDAFNDTHTSLKATVAGQTDEKSFTIHPKQQRVWSANATMLVRLKQKEIYLTLTSDGTVMMSARVFEAEDLDESCTDALLFNWATGITKPAGVPVWYKVNIKDAKANTGQDVCVVVTNNGTKKLTLIAGQSLDCPSSGVTRRTIELAAGQTLRDTIPNTMLNGVAFDELYVSLENDQPITVTAEYVNRPLVPVLPADPMGLKYEEKIVPDTSLHTVDVTTLSAGVTYYFKYDVSKLNALKKYEPEFTFRNTGSTQATIDRKMAFDVPAFSAQGNTLVLDGNDESIEVLTKNTLLGLDNAYIYVMITSDQDIQLISRFKHLREGKACRTNIDFDWINGHTQAASTKLWYAIDVADARDNIEDIVVHVQNLGNAKASLDASVAFSCPYIDLQEMHHTLAAGATEVRTLGYSTYAMMTDTIWIGVETNQSIKFWASTKPAKTTEPDEACLNAVKFNWEEGAMQNGGDTVWYKISMDEVREKSAKFPTVFVQNLSSTNPAKITAELSLECPDSIANQKRTKTLAANESFSKQLSRNLFENIVQDTIYLKVITTEAIALQIRLTEEAEGASCSSAIPFNWVSGNSQNANDNFWYVVDMRTVMQQGNDIRLHIENRDNATCKGVAQLIYECPTVSAPSVQDFTLKAHAEKSITVQNSAFETLSDSMAYVNLQGTTGLRFWVELLPLKHFDTIYADGLTLIPLQWDTLYTQTVDTAWYIIPNSEIEKVRNLEEKAKPVAHLINLGSAMTIKAEGAFAFPITKKMMTKSQKLKANQHFTDTVPSGTFDQIIKKDSIIIRVTRPVGGSNFQFRAELVSAFSGNTRNDALPIRLGERYTQGPNTEMWYKLNTADLKKDTTLFNKALLVVGKNAGKGDAEVQVSVYEGLLSEVDLLEEYGLNDYRKRTVKKGQSKSHNIPAQAIYGVGDVELYIKLRTTDSLLFETKFNGTYAPKAVDPKQAEAKLLAPNVEYVVPGDNQEHWYMVCIPYMQNNYIYTDDAKLEYELNGKATIEATATFQDEMDCAMPVRKRTINKSGGYHKGAKPLRELIEKAIKKAGQTFDFSGTDPEFMDSLLHRYITKDSITGYVRIKTDNDLKVKLVLEQTTGDACMNAMMFDWEHGNVNPAHQKTWYQVTLDSVAIPDSCDLRLHVDNWSDALDSVQVSASVYFECGEKATISKTYKQGQSSRDSIDIDRDLIANLGWPPYMFIEYNSDTTSHIWAELIPNVPRDTLRDTIIAYVCAGETYTDTITNTPYVINYSMEWRDTVEFQDGPVMKDSITLFQVHPLVAPEALTVDSMKKLNAAPVLVQGMQLFVDSSSVKLTEIYRAHALAVDTIFKVDTVYWAKPVYDEGDLDVTDEASLNLTSYYPKTKVLDTLLLVIKGGECGVTYRKDIVFPLEDWKYAPKSERVCPPLPAVNPDTIPNVTTVLEPLYYNRPRYIDTVVTYVALDRPTMIDQTELAGLGVMPSVGTTGAIDTTNTINALQSLFNSYDDQTIMDVTFIEWEAQDAGAWHKMPYTVTLQATDSTINMRYLINTECGVKDTSSLFVINVPAQPTPCENKTIVDPLYPSGVVACDSFSWALNNDTMIYTNGTYYYNDGPISAGSACDLIYYVDVKINKSIDAAPVDSVVCAADMPIIWGGQTIGSKGLYYDTLRYASSGCDSIRLSLNVIVLNAAEASIDSIVCAADLPIIWGGQTIGKAGQYYDTLYYVETGCDSIYYTLNLSVMNASKLTIDTVVCAADLPISWGGQIIGAEGAYYDTLYYAKTGCDSIYCTLNVIVQTPVNALPEDSTICESDLPITWRNRTITSAGLYYDTLYYASTDCDSIYYTLNLTTLKPDSTIETLPKVYCNMYKWEAADTVITESGSYYHTFTNVHSCDSVVRLDVKISMPYVDTLEVKAYYGYRVIMINRNQINSIPGWKLDSLGIEHPEYVTWYQMLGATPDITTDKKVGTGYYYTLPSGEPLPAGDKYYAYVDIPASSAAVCGALGITEVITIGAPAAAPALVPSLAKPGEDIQVINLDPTVETLIRIYTAEGLLQKTYKAYGDTSFTIKAAGDFGFYLVELSNESLKSTLRYIVK